MKIRKIVVTFLDKSEPRTFTNIENYSQEIALIATFSGNFVIISTNTTSTPIELSFIRSIEYFY